MLYIYNTLTRQKELFKPIVPGKASMYVCGMTVYDYCHIGHGRLFVVYDVVARYLRSQGYQVTYVRNITDIDDKIIKRANENGEPYTAVVERFVQATHEDERALSVLPQDFEPRATQYIEQIIAMTQTLLDKGYAYVADNGDVYYHVKHFADYGQLAHQNLEKLRAGARVEVTDAKRDPLDFVLWKLSKPNEPQWDSPWGKGRPGWHIECSAMALQLLGQNFDIHGGGADLIFPHHQNELAQSEAVTGTKFVNYWMHLGMVQVNREKMSKSLGNFFTIRDVLAKYPAEVLRYFMIASHYRSPVNYSLENLDSARAALERLYTTLRGLAVADATPAADQEYSKRFNQAMNDDFNTPEALAVMFDLAREINRLRDENLMEDATRLGAQLKKLGEILGILTQDPELFLKAGSSEQDIEYIEKLIEARNIARKNKNWTESDRLRNELAQMGIILEDSPQGTLWRREVRT